MQTTLLNHILTAQHGKRIAVIENEVFILLPRLSIYIYVLDEMKLDNDMICLWLQWLQFGEVDIDGSLVASHSSVSEDIVMVNNGCLCCTVRGDLVKMLLQLAKKKQGQFDHIVIETTGV